MEFDVRYYYDSDTGIFTKYYFGKIQINDVFNSWENLLKKKIIPEHVKKFIINYKEATITFKSEKVDDIAHFYKKHDNVFANSKIAMVMETPDQVVFPHLMEFRKINFQIKAFYTMEAAKKWLQDTV